MLNSLMNEYMYTILLNMYEHGRQKNGQAQNPPNYGKYSFVFLYLKSCKLWNVQNHLCQIKVKTTYAHNILKKKIQISRTNTRPYIYILF